MSKIDDIPVVKYLSTANGLLGEVKYKKGLGLIIPLEIQENLYYLLIEKEVLREMLEDLSIQDDLR